MTRTQSQLPDEVFAKTMKLCGAREISLAELARPGIESILSVYAEAPQPRSEKSEPCEIKEQD